MKPILRLLTSALCSASRLIFSRFCRCASRPSADAHSGTARRSLYGAQDVSAAADTYRDAGNQPPMWNKIGIAYHQLGQLELARKSYERAIKLDKKYADAINNVGTVFYAEKKYRTAIARYNKAISISPNSASFWSNLGTAYYARGKFDEMTKAYTRAIELDPEVFEVHGSVGTRMLDRSVADRARYHYEIARMYALAREKRTRDSISAQGARRRL